MCTVDERRKETTMKKKILLSLLTLVAMGAIFVPAKTFAADQSETQQWTVTIPDAIDVVLKSGVNFTPTATDIHDHTSSTATNVIVIGNGTTGSDSYIAGTDPATYSAKQYTMTFSKGGGDTSTPTLTSPSSDLLLTVVDATAGTEATVTFNLRKSGQTTNTVLPKMGITGDGNHGTGAVAFAFDTGTMNIAAASSVGYDPTTNICPLDMEMDLNEASLSYADHKGAHTFSATLTIVNPY